LIWFVDDIEIARWQNNRISDVPMYIIINTNMGGWATDHIEKKKLPDQTIIDYVRVWQGKAKL
jgi:beta-glucanase (GH16 family)